MVLIITEKADRSTINVIDWLTYLNIKWVRINEDILLDYLFTSNDIEFNNGINSFKLSDIKAVWYRRGQIKLKYQSFSDKNINNTLKTEYVKLHEFIYYKLSLLPHINVYQTSEVNKLIVSDVARKCGLKTPKDYLFSNFFLTELDSTIKYSTKPIAGSNVMDYDDFFSIDYTVKIDKDTVIPSSFFPSLVQNYVEKKYEIRIFYLHGEFWSMAIFSQNDKTTETDFRNYNRQKPNRNVPFNIPKYLKKQLIELMTRLRLNCGSIDMILSPENDFYFLEVNPIGQYGMIDKPCNYHLNKEIANFFKQHCND